MLLSPDFGVLCNHLPGVNDNINIINLMFHLFILYLFAALCLLNKFVNKTIQYVQLLFH